MAISFSRLRAGPPTPITGPPLCFRSAERMAACRVDGLLACSLMGLPGYQDIGNLPRRHRRPWPAAARPPRS